MLQVSSTCVYMFVCFFSCMFYKADNVASSRQTSNWMFSFPLFRSFIQPATLWSPNPSLRWSLPRKRRRRTGLSMGKRERRTSHPKRTKPHLQARNKERQKLNSLKWTLTNWCSSHPSFTSVHPAALHQFCHSPEIVIDGTVASFLKTQTAASLIIYQSAFSTCHFSFSLTNTKVLHNNIIEWTTL